MKRQQKVKSIGLNPLRGHKALLDFVRSYLGWLMLNFRYCCVTDITLLTLRLYPTCATVRLNLFHVTDNHFKGLITKIKPTSRRVQTEN